MKIAVEFPSVIYREGPEAVGRLARAVDEIGFDQLDIFDHVVLVDIAHLWSVHRQARRFPNVHPRSIDVTGVVEHCHQLARERTPPRLPQRKVDCLAGEQFDLVVSLNILSQLPVVPNEYMSRRIRSLTDARRREFSRALVRNHLDWLCACPGIACLVADLERLHFDDCGIVSRESSLWGIELPGGGREWLWDLAPRPEMYFHLDVRHRVVGYPVFPKQDWLTPPGRSGERCGMRPTSVHHGMPPPAGLLETP